MDSGLDEKAAWVPACQVEASINVDASTFLQAGIGSQRTSRCASLIRISSVV